MSASPSFESFERAYSAGRPQVIWRALPADLITPVGAFLGIADECPNSFLLESVGVSEGDQVRGRYSIIGLRPDLIWRCRDGAADINRNALNDPDSFEPCDDTHALESLRRLVGECRIELPEQLPPMAAGLFGYLGYDMVRLMERLPSPNTDVLQVPEAVLVRPTIVAIFDVVRDVLTLVTPVWPAAGVSAKAAYNRAIERLDNVEVDLERPLSHVAREIDPYEKLSEPQSNTTKAEYRQIVERAKEYIRAGDVFQVVPSQRFFAPFEHSALTLYRSLRRVNPSPYMYCLNFDGFSVVGSSPEILVRVVDDRVTIRPIAGTRHRGKTQKEDQQLSEELLSDEKERAEHLMLLDLGRNDVGRVAKVNSVEVTDSFFMLYLSHVMHIVSNVEGDLSDDYDALSALIAGFPAGTVSGAPKIRAMEIIDELEKEKRGVYAGAVGYFSANGTMDTCIVLRTALLKDGVMHVQAGGGVVADSDPDFEYQETVNKAKAVFRAAEEAIDGLHALRKQ